MIKVTIHFSEMANARSTLKGMPDFVTTFMVAPTEVLPMSVVNQQADTRAAAAAAAAENVSDVLSTTSSTTVPKVVLPVAVPAVNVSPTTLSNSDIAASKDSKSAAVFTASVSSVAIDETPAVISNVPLFPAPNFGIVEPACLPDLNVCRHLPTRSLRGVNVFQVDSETGFIPCLGLAPFDTTIMRRFTDMENAEGRNDSAVLIQMVEKIALPSSCHKSNFDFGKTNIQPSFVSSLSVNMILAVSPVSYNYLLEYLASPKYVDIRSRIQQFVCQQGGPLAKNFDQKNFVNIITHYPASDMTLAVKTVLYNYGGKGERKHRLVNLLGYFKSSWDRDSIPPGTDFMHLPVNSLLQMQKNTYEMSLERFFLVRTNRDAGKFDEDMYDSLFSPYPGLPLEGYIDAGLLFSPSSFENNEEEEEDDDDDEKARLLLAAAEEVATAGKSAVATTPSRNKGGVVSGERSIEDKTDRAVVAKPVVQTRTSYDGDIDDGEIQKTPPMARSVLAGRYRKSVSRESGDRSVDSLNHSKASNQSRDSSKDSIGKSLKNHRLRRSESRQSHHSRRSSKSQQSHRSRRRSESQQSHRSRRRSESCKSDRSRRSSKSQQSHRSRRRSESCKSDRSRRSNESGQRNSSKSRHSRRDRSRESSKSHHSRKDRSRESRYRKDHETQELRERSRERRQRDLSLEQRESRDRKRRRRDKRPDK